MRIDELIYGKPKGISKNYYQHLCVVTPTHVLIAGQEPEKDGYEDNRRLIEQYEKQHGITNSLAGKTIVVDSEGKEPIIE